LTDIAYSTPRHINLRWGQTPMSSCAIAVQEAADLTQEERTAAAE
jgi:hypothetical protein